MQIIKFHDFQRFSGSVRTPTGNYFDATIVLIVLRKVKKFQESKINLDIAHNPNFFGNPSLTYR